MMNYFRCPVCAYPKLTEPPLNFSICPSCGTEFENDDYDRTHEDLRRAWLAKGAPWFSRATLPPPNWSGLKQLLKAGQGFTLKADTSNGETRTNIKYSHRPRFSFRIAA